MISNENTFTTSKKNQESKLRKDKDLYPEQSENIHNNVSYDMKNHMNEKVRVKDMLLDRKFKKIKK